MDSPWAGPSLIMLMGIRMPMSRDLAIAMTVPADGIGERPLETKGRERTVRFISTPPRDSSLFREEEQKTPRSIGFVRGIGFG